MKKIYPLTDTQRNYAGNHVGLVYKFLYLNHLDIDEYYDIVIFGYLLAVQLYDEDERLKNRYLFSTIACLGSKCGTVYWSITEKPAAKNATPPLSA